MQQQSVEGESEDEESDVHSDTDDDSSSSDDQLEVEVITDIDDFLLNFQNFFRGTLQLYIISSVIERRYLRIESMIICYTPTWAYKIGTNLFRSKPEHKTRFHGLTIHTVSLKSSHIFCPTYLGLTRSRNLHKSGHVRGQSDSFAP